MTLRTVSAAALEAPDADRIRTRPSLTQTFCPLSDFAQLAQQLGYKPSPKWIEARARKADFANRFLADPKKKKAICGASMYNTAHTSGRWTRKESIDVEGDEYLLYEFDVSERAFKEAKMKATAIRAHFKGKGEI